MRAVAVVSSEIPHFFSRDLREIPPALNEELLDLYGRSEQVLGNRFAFLNLAEVLPADFDWEMHESPAWRCELHAFDYGLDLALTFRISQEERYARHLRYLVAHWIALNPPGQTTGWEPAPLARRVRNWILAADLARGDWERDSAFLYLVERSLALQCVYLASQAPGAAESFDNAVVCSRALMLAGRFFRGNRAEEMGDLGRQILLSTLEKLTAPEAGLPPPDVCLHLAEALLECLAFRLPAEIESRASLPEATRRLIAALEGTLLPDRTLPLFGPSARLHGDDPADVFALAAVLFNEPKWKSLAGQFGIMPYMMLGEAAKSRFAQLADESWRSGSSAVPELRIYRLNAQDGSAMIVNARPAIARGEHQDYLSYELSLRGQRLVVDSGSYSPPGESWDAYFPNARAHNVLLVNDEPSRPHSLSPRLPKMEGQGSPGGVQCVCLSGNGFNFLKVEHHRAFFCLEGGAWAVLDWLDGSGRRNMTNLVHFYPTFELEAGENWGVARSRSLSVTVIPLGSAPVQMTAARGQHPKYRGFYSPDFGVKFPSSTLAIETQAASLPWLGGYLIIPSAEPDFQAGEANPSKGTVSFRLSGKDFCLTLRREGNR